MSDDWTPEQADAVADAAVHHALDQAGVRTALATLEDTGSRDGVDLLEATMPAGGRDDSGLRREALDERYVIDETRHEQVLAVLVEHAPHLLQDATHDPLDGIEPGDPDYTLGSTGCPGRSWPDPLADGYRWPCTRGRHPSRWRHLAGDGRQVLVVWGDDE